MKAKIFIVGFLCAFSVANGNILEASEKTRDLIKYGSEHYENLPRDGQLEYLNEMVDSLLEELRLVMSDLGLDPLQLPDVQRNFSYKPIIITYHGEFDLVDGWAQDVSEIYRDGNVVVDYTNRVLTFNVPLRISRILFDYKYKVKIMGLGPSGGVDGRADNIRFFFSLAVDFKELKLHLNEFEMSKIGKISVKFNGNILFDWLVNLLTGLTVTIFRGLITWIVELIVKSNLVGLVDLINQILANGTVPEDYSHFQREFPMPLF